MEGNVSHIWWGYSESKGIVAQFLSSITGTSAPKLPCTEDAREGGHEGGSLTIGRWYQKRFLHRRSTQHAMWPCLVGGRHVTPLDAEAYITGPSVVPYRL